MRARVVTFSVIVTVIVALVGTTSWVMLSACPPGRFVLVEGDVGGTEVPQDVREGASTIASEYAETGSPYWRAYRDSLLEVYCGLPESDFLLVFNSGGQGMDEIGPEWASILDGLREELDRLGYTNVLVIYERTGEGFANFLRELRETALSYHEKAKALASAVDFLVGHAEGSKVIFLGESAGAMMSSEAMRLLGDNERVFSIGTGTPFYYHAVSSERSLVINDNGLTPDTMHTADLWTVFKANLGRIPTYRPEEGHFLFYLRTPGHIYTWDHPGVRSQVTAFLEEQFAGE
ncbi:MAG: hypothetical protein ACOC58_02725 [Chloroflexota bacterium]